MLPSKTHFYYNITYWMSGPIAKFMSPFIIHYFGISPIISPICVELTSYIIIQPINYFIIQPFSYKLLSYYKSEEDKDKEEYIFI